MSYTSRNPVLPDGYSRVPPGKVVSVVTELEMRAPPPRLAPRPQGFALERIGGAEVERHLRLFRALGERWFWFSRLVMPREELTSLLDDAAVESFVVTRGGADAGLLEIDRREPGAVELTFIGLLDEATGQGAGRWLVGEAVRRTFSSEARRPEETRRGAARLWVHTCNLDDPRALGFYQACGFVPCGQSVEVADDPRLSGHLPRHARPDVPVLEP